MGERAIKVVAAELSISGGGEHLEDAITHLEHADVEGATAEVIHGDLLMLVELVETVSKRRGGGLAEDALDREAGELACFFGGGTLRIIEEGWHGDHRATDRLLQSPFSDAFEVFEDFRGNIHRRDAELFEVVVWLPAAFATASADEPLHRRDRAARMQGTLPQCDVSDGDLAVFAIANRTRRAATAIFIGEQDGKAAVHHADERIRRAEVDAEDGGEGRFRFQVSGG